MERMNIFHNWNPTLLVGKIFCKKDQTISIDQEAASQYVAFAQSDMIDTFVWGASTEVLVQIENQLSKRIDALEENLKASGEANAAARVLGEKEAAKEAFRKELLEYLFQSHQVPLRRVIANLPINELAELAETLIALESLRERVRTPDESVSGPIDVAVISKGDGFIWIKRKHYFEGRLNPRFFARRNLAMEE
jgi:hypothetical protein